MTNIIFSPALNVQTGILPAVSTDKTVRLTCRARLSATFWEALQKRRAFVEIWSNIPMENASSGQWMPKAFEYISPSTTTTTTARQTQSQTQTRTRTAPSSHDGEDTVELVTTFDIPATPHKQYSYTYRIKQTSGEVEWLGNMRSNGSIMVEPTAYWTPSAKSGSSGSSGSSVIGNLGGGQWKGWSLGLGEAPVSISLPGNFAPSRTLYLTAEDTTKGLNAPPSIVVHSTGGKIDVSGEIVYCDTPDKVTSYAVDSYDYDRLVEVISNFGYTVTTSPKKDSLLVSSGTWDQHCSFQICSIWVSRRAPFTGTSTSTSTVVLKPDHIKPLLASWSNACIVSYPTIGHVILQEKDVDIPLMYPNQTITITCMKNLPQSPNQFVGVLTPAKLHHSPPSSPISSLGSSSGSHMSPNSKSNPNLDPHSPPKVNSHAHPHPDYPAPAKSAKSKSAKTSKSAKSSANTTAQSTRPVFTITKSSSSSSPSSSSRVLLSKNILIPGIISRQLGRLFQIRFLAIFYSLVIYVLSLLTRIVGISFSVEWPPASPPYSSDSKAKAQVYSFDEKPLLEEYEAKPYNAYDAYDETTHTKTNGGTTTTTTAAAAAPTSTSTTPTEMLFDIIPRGDKDKDKELKVLFDGEAADNAIFTLNGRPVDPSKVVQTWISDNLHLFTVKLKEFEGAEQREKEKESSPLVLGVSVGPGTPV